MSPKISVTVLTKNSEKYLREVLSALEGFEEVLIYDNGSTDSTLSIAESFPNASIVHGAFEGFGRTHNKASEAARNPWILSIDSDEIVTPAMFHEIAEIPLDEGTVYSFPRNNYFNGKFIKWCGWYPDRQIRLYNKKKTRFSDAKVHEAILTSGMRVVGLSEPFIHYSYASISDFLTKMKVYSELFAKQYRGKRSSSLFQALGHGAFAFFKSYILKRGFLGGYEGFVISAYNSHTAYYKYLMLFEANKEK